MKRDALRLLTSSLLLGLTFSAVAGAQESAKTTPLQRANRTFAAADLNRDGQIDGAEVKKASIPSSVLKSWDADANLSLSRDEFLGYYRRLMVNAGQQPGADLDKEVKRIEAEQKTRKEREARSKARDAQRVAGEGQAKGESTAEKYKRAQGALNERLKRAGATRQAAGQEQKELAQRARSASGSVKLAGADAGATETARERLARAQAALEDRARNAGASREQLADAQAQVEKRARKAAASNQGAGENAGEVTNADRNAQLRKNLARAEDALVDRAQSGDMTREQQQALKKQLEDRARNAAQGDSPAAGSAASKTGAKSGSKPGSKTAQAAPKVKQAGVVSAAGTGSAKTRQQDLASVPATERQKVGRALDAMEERAKAGNWSREKFAKEKQDLLDRAIAAHNSNAAGGASKGETAEERKQREARKRAAAVKQNAAGETPEQRKQREARKRAADSKQKSNGAAKPASKKPDAKPAAKPKGGSTSPAKKATPAAKKKGTPAKRGGERKG